MESEKYKQERHAILDEVLEASQVFFEPNKARFINDAMEMYAMYRIAEQNQINNTLRHRINILENLLQHISTQIDLNTNK